MGAVVGTMYWKSADRNDNSNWHRDLAICETLRNIAAKWWLRENDEFCSPPAPIGLNRSFSVMYSSWMTLFTKNGSKWIQQFYEEAQQALATEYGVNDVYVEPIHIKPM